VTDIAVLLLIDKKQLNNWNIWIVIHMESIWNPYGWYLEYMPNAGNGKTYLKSAGERSGRQPASCRSEGVRRAAIAGFSDGGGFKAGGMGLPGGGCVDASGILCRPRRNSV
jgi:hypothetical protein